MCRACYYLLLGNYRFVACSWLYGTSKGIPVLKTSVTKESHYMHRDVFKTFITNYFKTNLTMVKCSAIIVTLGKPGTYLP